MSGAIDVAKFFEAKTPLSEAAQTQAAAQLQPFHIANVVQHSFDAQRPTYVMHLDARILGDNIWKVAIACSDNVGKLYDYNAHTGQLTFTHLLRGHKDNINDIQFSPHHPHIVCTASEDGLALCWDIRTGQVVHTFRGRGPLSSCSLSDTTLAASGAQDIFLWDIRTAEPKPTISDFHSSDILRVRFNPLRPTRLFSSSDDGTVMQFDLTIEDLDEAMVTVMNAEQPVSRFGFFGPQAEYLFAISTVETLTLWECAKGNRLGSFTDIRQQLAQATHMQVDYLVQCHYSASQQRLFLTAGSFQGALLLCHVNTRDVQPFCVLRPPEGHSGVIRDSLFFENTVLTGGEDSKICIWSNQSLAPAAAATPHSPPPTSGPVVSSSDRQGRKFSPY